MAINRPVSICGVSVSPGDLVIAAEVLAVAQRLTKREDDRLPRLDSAMPLTDWIKL